MHSRKQHTLYFHRLKVSSHSLSVKLLQSHHHGLEKRLKNSYQKKRGAHPPGDEINGSHDVKLSILITFRKLHTHTHTHTHTLCVFWMQQFFSVHLLKLNLFLMCRLLITGPFCPEWSHLRRPPSASDTTLVSYSHFLFFLIGTGTTDHTHHTELSLACASDFHSRFLAAVPSNCVYVGRKW